MKVLYCGQAAYRYLPSDFAQRYDSVVTTPYLDLVEPAKMHESLHSYVEELLLAARSGFDGVMVTEHSQTSYDLSPNPNLAASISRTPPRWSSSTLRSRCSAARSASRASRCGSPRSTR